QKGADGKTIKIDKSDPKLFLIPDEDARRIIRAATRSAYAEACELPDLARANYQTLMRSEEAKKIWTEQQLLMINALHMFSTSYFSGNVKISEGAPANDDSTNASQDKDAEKAEIVPHAKPSCPPEQKLKVQNSINAFVQSAQSAQAPAPAKPAVP